MPRQCAQFAPRVHIPQSYGVVRASRQRPPGHPGRMPHWSRNLHARVIVRSSRARRHIPQPHGVIRASRQGLPAIRGECHAQNLLMCCLKERTSRPVATSHNRMVLSPPPGQRQSSVGRKRHAGHGVFVPGSSSAAPAPVATSHSRTVSSALPDSACRPSGENATLVTQL